MTLLEAQQVSKSFRGLRAVSNVSLAVETNTITALIGPNGAGKTTLFNLIAGTTALDAGKILFSGNRIDGLRPDQLCELGIARTFQIVKPFNGLTVLDNVIVGALKGNPRLSDAQRQAESILEHLGLGAKRDLPASVLTLPDRKRLEVARAIATRPKLLLLDEALAGLRPTECEPMIEFLREINRREGVTILLIEHVMRAVMALAHSVTVLHQGEVVARGTPEEIVREPAVLECYLGVDAAMMSVLLEVRDLDVFYEDAQALSGVSLDVPNGEIVAIVGSNGAGKSTLIRAIAGIERARAGSISFSGRDLGGLDSHEICNLGIGQVAEGRQLFPSLTTLENLQMGAMLPRGRRHLKQTLNEVFALFPRLGERRKQLAGTLSGGEQQMLAIGRCLMGRPGLMMLDEPSLGLAPNVVQQLLHTVQQLNKKGLTVLLVEQNVALSLKISQRAYVLENGRIVMSGAGSELLANDRVRQAYLGL